jgi:hypothetical protein
MQLESLVARPELQATQFHAELDRVERELRRTDQVGRQITMRMRPSFGRGGAGSNRLRTAVTALAEAPLVREVLS